MSCLLVDELLPTTVIKQRFRVLRDTDVAHIRFAFYKHNNPTGTLKLSIYQNDILIAESKIVTDQEIDSRFPLPYAYGLLRFDFDNHLTLHVAEGETKTEYEMRLEATGGTILAFYGTYRKYEDQIYKGYNEDGTFDQAKNDTIEPYHYEIYEYTY